MSEWQRRLTGILEPLLHLADPRPQISAYHDMPYAIFHYEAKDELALREAVQLLATRLQIQSGKRVTHISLADCLATALERSGLNRERIEAAEKRTGLAKTLDTLHKIISDEGRHPLDRLVAERIPTDATPTRDIAFVVRTGALFPFYRTSSLCEQLKGKVSIPAVLFYPGELDGPAGLKFMGRLQAEHNYRPKIF